MICDYAVSANRRPRAAEIERVPSPLFLQQGTRQPFKPVVRVVADPVTAVSDIQSGDGSFSLDGSLLKLLQRKKSTLSLISLKASIPPSIRSSRNAEKVWGTVLGVAYMMIGLAGGRSIWDSLFDKARDFVCREANMEPHQFFELVRIASAQLQ